MMKKSYLVKILSRVTATDGSVRHVTSSTPLVHTTSCTPLAVVRGCMQHLLSVRHFTTTYTNKHRQNQSTAMNNISGLYSMSNNRSSPSNFMPLEADMLLTTPLTGACTTISIFIALNTTSG